jgi:hypothetical protein
MNKVICPKCHKEAPWVENKERYGKNYGKSYMCYFCRPCGTYVGCHNNTRKPLGEMADKETMEWRIKAHAVIDPLWRGGKMKREEVYRMLREKFGREIHIGESNVKMCEQIISFLAPSRHKNNPSNKKHR